MILPLPGKKPKQQHYLCPDYIAYLFQSPKPVGSNASTLETENSPASWQPQYGRPICTVTQGQGGWSAASGGFPARQPFPTLVIQPYPCPLGMTRTPPKIAPANPGYASPVSPGIQGFSCVDKRHRGVQYIFRLTTITLGLIPTATTMRRWANLELQR